MILASLVLLAVLAVPARARQDLPEGLRDVGIDPHVGTPLPLDAEFLDEDARPVRLGRYFGRHPVILVFAYYRCPMLCTQVLNGLVDGLRPSPQEAGREFDVVVVSFDARERAPLAWLKKKNYLDSYGRPGAASGWHFLTGKEDAIRRLTDAAGFRFRYDANRDQFAHASGLLVVTPQGRIARYYYGIRFAPAALRDGVRDAASQTPEARFGRTFAAGPAGALAVLATLRRPPRVAAGAALWEAPAAGETGSPPTLLYCFQYDPVTGRVTILTMRAVRVGGVLTLAGLAAGVMWMKRRARRRTLNKLATAE